MRSQIQTTPKDILSIKVQNLIGIHIFLGKLIEKHKLLDLSQRHKPSQKGDKEKAAFLCPEVTAWQQGDACRTAGIGGKQ